MSAEVVIVEEILKKKQQEIAVLYHDRLIERLREPHCNIEQFSDCIRILSRFTSDGTVFYPNRPAPMEPQSR